METIWNIIKIVIGIAIILAGLLALKFIGENMKKVRDALAIIIAIILIVYIIIIVLT